MVVKRVTITILNIVFPPLAVFLLCGFGRDLLINSILFLLAVIPAHIHGFYISFVYFSRKRKVRKGVYPGPPRALIYSEKVQNGGATKREVWKQKHKQDMKQSGVSLKDRLFHRGSSRKDSVGRGSYFSRNG